MKIGKLYKYAVGQLVVIHKGDLMRPSLAVIVAQPRDGRPFYRLSILDADTTRFVPVWFLEEEFRPARAEDMATEMAV